MKPRKEGPARVIAAVDVIEDWGVGWHLGRVIECLATGDDLDALRAARFFMTRKIAHVQAYFDDEPSPCARAQVMPIDVIEDWGLPVHLGGVLSVLFDRRQHDVPMLREALGFLEQRIQVLGGR